ncbi:MAG: hypothetical protein Alis3KO_41390 [Aliiglaciecola sp.]
MKVIEAKLNTEPYHSLSIKDVKYILGLVPEHWYRNVNKIVLSSTHFNKSRFDRPVFGHAGLFDINILSRGFTKQEIAEEFLRELAVLGRVAQTQSFNHIPKKELKKVDEVIEPLLQDFLNART